MSRDSPTNEGSEPWPSADHTIVAATRPDRLALISWLHGGPRPKVDRFRVLAMGCGHGANLLALAFYHPECHFVGIDGCVANIQRIRAAAEELGLANLRCENHALASLPAAEAVGGPFDYIILHDQISWLEQSERALALGHCRALMSREGVAYLDHHIAAGWHLRESLRGFLAPAAEPVGQLARLNILNTGLAALLPEAEEKRFFSLLADEVSFASRLSPQQLERFYLGEATTFSFSEIEQYLQAHGLCYLAEAELTADNPEQVRRAAWRRRLVDVGVRGADLEDLIDLVTQRRFRSAVICRADARLGPRPPAEDLRSLYVAADLAPVGDDLRLTREDAVDFATAAGTEISSRSPLMSAALVVLAERFPAGVQIDPLIDAAVDVLAEHGLAAEVPDDGRLELTQQLLDLCERGAAEVRLWEPTVPATPSRRPHPLALFEAKRAGSVTTPYHTVLPLDDFARQALLELAEAKTSDEVAARLLARIHAGELLVQAPGLAATPPEQIASAVRHGLASALVFFANLGLLAPE